MKANRKQRTSFVESMSPAQALELTILGLARASSIDEMLLMIEAMIKIRGFKAAKAAVEKSEPVQRGNQSEANK